MWLSPRPLACAKNWQRHRASWWRLGEGDVRCPQTKPGCWDTIPRNSFWAATCASAVWTGIGWYTQLREPSAQKWRSKEPMNFSQHSNLCLFDWPHVSSQNLVVYWNHYKNIIMHFQIRLHFNWVLIKPTWLLSIAVLLSSAPPIHLLDF